MKTFIENSKKSNIFWITFLALGFLMAFVITDKAWRKFQNNPTLTSMAIDDEGMKIHFPTITVCPIFQQKVKESEKRKLNQNVLKDFANFPHRLKTLKLFDWSNFFLHQNSSIDMENARSKIFELSPTCNNVLGSCKFNNKEIDCWKYFLPVLSEHGLCYSFNSHFHDTPTNEVLNKHLFLIDSDGNEKLQFQPKIPANIFLNAIDEPLSLKQIHIEETNSQSSTLAFISLKQTKTNGNVRELSTHQRKCVFKDEIQMKYYQDQPYSLSICLRECRIDEAIELCGCLPPFYRPAILNLRFCDVQDTQCFMHHDIWSEEKCSHCYLTCDVTVFSLENVQSISISESSAQTNNFKLEIKHGPILNFYRQVRFGFVDFLVAFGSVLALFLSLSVLSGVEILFCFLHYLSAKIWRRLETD
ncbi:CLUMA_CG006714, isoform A [Clunio marinus]|uniref:CLUMA_CG006714, isoform A n=1 Tax=Clunio marinus TaxID=568069 RepID=A0A1J1I002_9DIPT|nr:CLUMA_CG006714, isoform A [Clunio marinus]